VTFADRLKVTRAHVDDPEDLELAVGDGVKRLEGNEGGTVIVQRRAVRARRDLPAGHRVAREDLIVLRPCPPGSLPPYRAGELVGRTLARPVHSGDCVRPNDCA
jgi:sialic acid synthase SpsE